MRFLNEQILIPGLRFATIKGMRVRLIYLHFPTFFAAVIILVIVSYNLTSSVQLVYACLLLCWR